MLRNKLFLLYILPVSLIASEAVVFDADLLTEKASSWEMQEHHNYQYLVHKQCFCQPEYTKKFWVTVNCNKVTEVVDAETGQKVPDYIFAQQRSISQWYQLALEASQNEHGEVDIKYEGDSSYPVSIYIDQHKMRADDEYTVFINELTHQ